MQPEPECGTERWLVKNLADRDTSLVYFSTAIFTTIEDLARQPVVNPKDDEARRPDERTMYSVIGRMVKYKLEDDGDIHLVIRGDLDSTIVAEIPNPDCPEVAATSRVELYTEVRRWFLDSVGIPTTRFKDVDRVVQVTGIGYYDQAHGQTGMAKNNRELHPVLYMR